MSSEPARGCRRWGHVKTDAFVSSEGGVAVQFLLASEAQDLKMVGVREAWTKFICGQMSLLCRWLNLQERGFSFFWTVAIMFGSHRIQSLLDVKKWFCTFHLRIVLRFPRLHWKLLGSYLNPYWVLHIHFGPLFENSVAYFPHALWKFQGRSFRVQKSRHFEREKNSVAGSMLDSFWSFQGSILGCVASMLDLFCVLEFNLGPILGFRGTIGAPSTPFYLLEKGCLFLDGTFSISRPCTCFNIDCGYAASVLTIDDPKPYHWHKEDVFTAAK